MVTVKLTFYVDKRINQCKSTSFVLFWVKDLSMFCILPLWPVMRCGGCVWPLRGVGRGQILGRKLHKQKQVRAHEAPQRPSSADIRGQRPLFIPLPVDSYVTHHCRRFGAEANIEILYLIYLCFIKHSNLAIKLK